MAERDPNRESHFPAIEKKHGEPMAHWHRVMAEVSGHSYTEQMSLLVDQYGFSRAHANALVMYTRGSTTTRRFDTPEDYFASLDRVKADTMRRIFSELQQAFPQLELVIAWNQPMLKDGTSYVFGASAATNHILIAPWRTEALADLRPRLAGYAINKKTIRIPPDWQVDAQLLRDMVGPYLGR